MQPTRERILITVKTYPTLSQKYGETVCTAGLREDGSWMRIYPVPFRRLDDIQRYKKYDWIEGLFLRNESDHRHETFRPANIDEVKRINHIGTEDGWRARKEIVLGKARVETKFTPLCDNIKKELATAPSLAVFKPTKVLGFEEEPDEREWDKKRLENMRNLSRQTEFDFIRESWRLTFDVITKLPYKFYYHFLDADGRKSRLQVLDWECGQLYWNCYRSSPPDLDEQSKERFAVKKVKETYFDKFVETDLHFFLGTLQKFHGLSDTPWNIVGTFSPPVQNQMELALG